MLNCCWESEKIKRPTFADIVDNIDKFLRSPEDLNNGLSSVTERNATQQSLFIFLQNGELWESLLVVNATQGFVALRKINLTF